MATLVCAKAFRLNTKEGMIRFAVGDKVEGKAAEHWYAKAHCAKADAKEAEAEAKAKAAAEAKAKAEAEAKAKADAGKR